MNIPEKVKIGHKEYDVQLKDGPVVMALSSWAR